MQEYIVREGPNGTQFWYKNGLLHRENGPAVIHADGEQLWYKNGKFHRENGPAIIYADGTQYWYKDGLLHREDGPAIICANGTQKYYLNDKYYTYEEWKQKVDPDSYDRKIVEIEGKKYQLKEVG